MLHPVIILLLAAVCSAHPLLSDLMAVNATPFNDERIIGGQEVVKNSYPFMVRFDAHLRNGNGQLCGASLLNEGFLLTAAHCVYNSRNPIDKLTLYFGDHNVKYNETTEFRMIVPPQYIRAHPKYDEILLTNDIAFIKLPKRLPHSDYVRPICVASPETAASFDRATAIGWGYTHNKGGASDVLKEVVLPILPIEECDDFGVVESFAHICAGNSQGIPEAVCSGDSGGPLLANPNNPIVIGLTSFGSRKGCVAAGMPVVFTRVSSYIPWLRGYMKDTLCVV